MLIEAAWSYRFPARISREQLLRQEALAKLIRDTAWRAQERLCRRYSKLARAGKLPTVITAAIARELNALTPEAVRCARRRPCSALRHAEHQAKPRPRQPP
jgi:hypothetical protein